MTSAQGTLSGNGVVEGVILCGWHEHPLALCAMC